ncbi:6,7-dimethyl-8-ribityllumazine synthase [Patescibacteria group bacterium]|nr:6,7-dimethyl-8-ribityllumazine synthase [Patescibacteria group bacterium]MBU1722060.1 6,7-dimethyl-8-ribityllumazine synthase [Patescibacteria group bacterium]MBU1901531.1 6,7-dimethyl-8-ribityllumazine synthase [Patescibacteria group bacterium]
MTKGITFEPVNGEGLRIGIVKARWNSQYTDPIAQGVLQALYDSGVLAKDVVELEVPGAYEVMYGAKHLIDTNQVDAIVCIGVLIKGESLHFEYISEAVSLGIKDLNIISGVPVVFGILTCLNEAQAEARSQGESNHGYPWGQTAIEMALLCKS